MSAINVDIYIIQTLSYGPKISFSESQCVHFSVVPYIANDTCNNMPQYDGAPVIATAVMNTRNNIKTSKNVSIKVAAQVIPFGETNGNLTLARVENCTKGGPLDICTICRVVSHALQLSRVS